MCLCEMIFTVNLRGFLKVLLMSFRQISINHPTTNHKTELTLNKPLSICTMKTKSSSSSDYSSVSKAEKKRLKKEKKRLKKEKKKEKKKRKREERNTDHCDGSNCKKQREIVESSAYEYAREKNARENVTTILLFYQYVEPPWSNEVYKHVLHHVEGLGKQAKVTGRMRIAKEGLNCTLTGSRESILKFCQSLRQWKPELFGQTEFKLTHELPERDRFPDLKIIPVAELVNYGLDGAKAPPIQQYHGTHLEPSDYHKKLGQKDTVVIDVRNHYEAAIGHFQPPEGTAEWVDPKMRRSTEFPAWLDDEKTKETLRDKTVLMYCTGGIRCERASALLKYKMDTDETVKDLNIRGVFQLQGGIDKYFKEFPDGGYWKGKNYVFDKRAAHLPPQLEGKEQQLEPLGKCEVCQKPWDRYKGKRRCPSCGVPSLICRDCAKADETGVHKLNASVRCDLCVAEGVFSKRDIRAKEKAQIEEYESRLESRGLLRPSQGVEEQVPANPGNVTRLYIKNMCRKNMTDEILMEFLPGITHIVWREDRKTGQFFGQGWVEMENSESAARAVAKSGEKVLGRPIHIAYQPPDVKDTWPLPSSRVR